MKRSRKGIREIPWGTLGDDPDGTCIYDNGHQEPEVFLARVLEFQRSGRSDVPPCDLEALTAKDVQHLRFRPMSPSECDATGSSYGVVTTESGGYPVTAVIL